MKEFYYAYFIPPHEAGVTTNWSECEQKVKRVRGARYRKFSNEQQAQLWLREGAPYAASPKGSVVSRASGEKKSVVRMQGVYFDAGTGRGMGLVEVNVTDERGESLLPKIVNPKRVTRFGTYVITRRTATNNYGELLALFYALEIASREGIKRVYGDSRLVIDYWSKGIIKQKAFRKSVYALVSKVVSLRQRFEAAGGTIEYISGNENPADLGFHRR